MIRMWSWGALYHINKHYNGNGKDGYNVAKNKYYTYSSVEKTKEFDEFFEQYQNIFKTEQTINEKDNIYFFKQSKYPRFKFSANCKNPKTIKIDKADKIVTPNIISTVTYFNRNSYLIIQDTLTENAYICERGQNVHLELYYKKGNFVDNVVALLQDKFLIQENNYTTHDDLLMIDNYQGVSKEFLQDIFDNIDKCVSEESLEKYVSKDSTELDEDMYNSIYTMLSCKDAGTVELGIKMLSNFNVEKSAFRLGMLIRSNIDNIAGNKAAQSAGFKNVMARLDLNLGQIRMMDTLSYLDKMYTASDTLNKDIVRSTALKEMEKKLSEYFSRENQKVTAMNITFTPTIS